MNDLFFACQDCREYIDAGYRWCYWTLEEPGIVIKGQPINVSDVLNAKAYWTVDAEWLEDLLPRVSQFLLAHKAHNIVYGNSEDFMEFDDLTRSDSFLDWINILNDRPDGFKPRDFVERLGFQTWSQVLDYVKDSANQPYWWHSWPNPEESPIHAARIKFESLAANYEKGK